MPNNDQILAVSVEARINKLEREMKKASGIVGKNFDGMEKRSKQATNQIENHFSGLAGRMGGIGKTMAAGFVGGLAAGGIMAMLGRGGDLVRGIAEIGDEAKRAGLGIEAFQELKFVAEQNRIGVDSLTDGLKELNLRADEFITTGGGSAAEAFARLGYDADTLKQKLKDPSALFTEIIGKLGQLDRAAAIRVADEIFGGTGGERFVQLIDQGEAALNRTRQAAHDLGNVLSAETIARADELDRKFNAIATTIGTNIKRAIVEVTGELIKFVDSLPNSQGEVFSDLQIRAAETQTTIEQLTMAAGRVFPALEEEVRALVIAFLDGKEGADETKNAILDMARANPDFSPLAGDLNGLISLFALLTGQAREAAAAIAAANSDGVGAAPTQDEFSATFFPKPVAAPVLSSYGGGGGGGGASSMREQRDAAKELITELEDELRLMGESDLEQRVNAELRRAGAGATDDQKASIRELVSQIDTEADAMQRLEDASENAKGIAKDFLGGLIGDLRSGVDGATSLSNAFGSLADRLIEMALDSVINSLFSNLMGGAGGGFLGGLFGFADGGVVKAATGGLIRGPGTGTSDSIPARLSDGEFVVNAAATRRNMALLRAVNDGKIAAFATGGLAGDSPSLREANSNVAGTAPAPSQNINVSSTVTVNANGGTPEQNDHLARQVSKQVENQMRAVVQQELRSASRPGGTFRRA